MKGVGRCLCFNSGVGNGDGSRDGSSSVSRDDAHRFERWAAGGKGKRSCPGTGPRAVEAAFHSLFLLIYSAAWLVGLPLAFTLADFHLTGPVRR